MNVRALDKRLRKLETGRRIANLRDFIVWEEDGCPDGVEWVEPFKSQFEEIIKNSEEEEEGT